MINLLIKGIQSNITNANDADAEERGEDVGRGSVTRIPGHEDPKKGCNRCVFKRRASPYNSCPAITP